MARKGSGCGKHGHKSKAAASSQLRSLLKARERGENVPDADRLNVYRCPDHGCVLAPWHVGHNKRGAKVNKYEN